MENNFLDPSEIDKDWKNNQRWNGVTRNFKAEDVVKIRNSVDIKYTLAENGANKLFSALQNKDNWISALGALSGIKQFKWLKQV